MNTIEIAIKELKERDKVIERLNERITQEKKAYINMYNMYAELQERIEKAIEYIENNSLYEQDYDYDYEENLVEGVPDDTVPKRILLEILRGDKE